jgi:hypothetical protein
LSASIVVTIYAVDRGSQEERAAQQRVEADEAREG